MQTQEGVILFADVVGSSALYEDLGDQVAAEQINRCLSTLSAITLKHQGVIIKTIGDAVMCRFPKADATVRAAAEMQTAARSMLTPLGKPITLRIGAHLGPFMVSTNDIAGDVVNVAAYLSNIAGAHKILLTEELVKQLFSLEKGRTRLFDHITLKGKQETTNIYEYMWEMTDVTTISIPVNYSTQDTQHLKLQAGASVQQVDAQTHEFWIGRHDSCQLVVRSNMSSRFHAKIEYRRGKFMLVDESTNGTFVTSNNEEVYIRRESVPLVGNGIISIGESAKNNNGQIIEYSLD
ncbi:MAG: adenylate/guanylate cyclase domain-containing protein [Gammaproteobacteria bacterium]|nr:adenylate/guanylate cyclase domain-containing protein [Gammaproteobacteria bacterium]